MMLKLLLLASVNFAVAEDYWAEVDYMINTFGFLPQVAFSAGDSRGRVHTHEKPSNSPIKMNTQLRMASSSKFPAAVAIAGAVADGHVDLTFDTKVNEVFSWWTTDPRDQRHNVTLRSLLNFASGLVCTDFSCGAKCLNSGCTQLYNGSYDRASCSVYYSSESCAYEIYSLQGPWQAGPGKWWSYHSAHLQLAGAMAAKAAKLPLNDFLKKYLLEKVPMPNSYWYVPAWPGYGVENPVLAEWLITTGDDYDALLQQSLTYKILPKEIMDQMELDAFRYWPDLKYSLLKKDSDLQYYGHYGMGAYFECIVKGGWSDACEKAGVHADPGAFGYWPLINRQKGYYLNLVAERHVKFDDEFMKRYQLRSDQVASLPGHCNSQLRFAIQPLIENALFGKKLTLGMTRQNGTRRLTDQDGADWLCEQAKMLDPLGTAGAPWPGFGNKDYPEAPNTRRLAKADVLI